MLSRLSILDTPVEQVYQDATLLASRVCGTPIALFTLIDQDRQWFKAKVGVDVNETPREYSFCSHAINKEGPTVIEDASLDEAFAENPLVTGDFHLRFYAGVPVHASNVPVGTLCVIDREARSLSKEQLESLEALARQLSSVLELRLLSRATVYREAALSDALVRAEELRSLSDYSARRFESLFEGMPVAGMTLDLQGNVMEWNEMSEKLFGYSATEIFGRNFVDTVVPSIIRDQAHRWFKEALHAGGSETEEGQALRNDGTSILLLARTLPLYAPTGELVGMICAAVDITERKRTEDLLFESNQLVESQRDALAVANAQLEVIASTDGLTGLRNRRSFEEYLDVAFAGAKRYGDPLSVLLLDVDKFKSINDGLGHAIGDEVLRNVAEVIRSSVRECDFAGRFGGEEFILVLQKTGYAGAVVLAERIRAAVEASKWIDQSVTVSIGVAALTADLTDKEELVRRADQAMYKAKRLGRNRVVANQQTPTGFA